MKHAPLAIVIGLASLALPALPARAQVPFFGQGQSIFDPEIGVVQSGVLNDVEAVVSADRKYVTMNMRPQNATLLSLQEFTFQRPGNQAPLGFVGGAGGGNANAAANPAPAAGNGRGAGDGGLGLARPGSAKPRRPSVLDRPGMTLVGRIYRAPYPRRPE